MADVNISIEGEGETPAPLLLDIPEESAPVAAVEIAAIEGETQIAIAEIQAEVETQRIEAMQTDRTELEQCREQMTALSGELQQLRDLIPLLVAETMEALLTPPQSEAMEPEPEPETVTEPEATADPESVVENLEVQTPQKAPPRRRVI